MDKLPVDKLPGGKNVTNLRYADDRRQKQWWFGEESEGLSDGMTVISVILFGCDLLYFVTVMPVWLSVRRKLQEVVQQRLQKTMS